MESNIKESNISGRASISPDNTSSGSGDSPEQRIAELGVALNVVKKNFIAYGKKLKSQIRVWAIICSLIVLLCIILGCFLINTTFPIDWNWQIAYASVIRVAIITAIFSLSAFCFKSFQSYIHLNEQNTHHITVIESMASIVGAAKDESQRNLIYGKLIDIIIHLGDTGFSDKKKDFKGIADINLDLIKSLLNKKE